MEKPTTFINNLKGIFELYFDKKLIYEMSPSESQTIRANMVEVIQNKYELSFDQVLILSYALHYRGSRLAKSYLVNRICPEIGGTSERVDDLIARRFLIESNMENGTSDLCCTLSEEAYQAILAGREYGAAPFEDCMASLFDPYLDVAGGKFLEKFIAGIRLDANKHFGDAFHKLKIEGLSKDGQEAFLILSSQFVRKFSEPYTNIIDNEDLTKGIKELIKNGLADSVAMEKNEETTYNHYVLSAAAVQHMFYGHDELIDYSSISTFATIYKSSSIKEKALFFSDEGKGTFEILKKLLSKDGYEHARGILQKQKRSTAILALLSGGPGTGKTESCRQLARETGRDIIAVDVSKLLGRYVGESEKNFRNMFLCYNYIVAVSSHAPILLLNEADSILGRRITDVNSGIGRMDNNISNITLEALESLLGGVVLATTNMLENLDSAFDRRFTFKAQLEEPDTEARKLIWKDNIPTLSDEEVASLATEYVFTGAQISNISAKRDLAELYYTGDRGFEYIKELCREELSGFKKKRLKPIGF